jgi:CRISPR-associated exonuclease Cas4
MESFDEIKTSGIKINYLYVCERKLWLSDRGIRVDADYIILT